MKFSKRNVLVASALIGIAIVSARLSLKTMEVEGQKEQQPQQHLHPHGPAYVPLLQMGLGLWTSARIDFMIQAKNKELIQKLQSPEALDEFRDKGTIKNQPLSQLVSNEWAFNILKPAVAKLVCPWLTLELSGYTSSVYSVAFSPDGTQIASGSGEHAVSVWTLQSGTWQPQELTGHTSLVFSVAFSPDGRHIASGSEDSTVRIWTLQNGVWQSQKLTGHTKGVRSVAFSPDGTHLASGSEDHTVRVWTLQNSVWQSEVLPDHTSWVHSVAFSPDGTRIASGSWDWIVRVWTLQSGTWQQPQRLIGHTHHLVNYGQPSVAFSPDGTHIASSSADDTIRVWTLTDGAWQSQELPESRDVRSIAFSPKGTRIAFGASRTVSVRTLTDDNWPSEVLGGHTDIVNAVAFSPDGTRIVSGSTDNTVRIWTQFDLVGDTNVAAKIMLLQLLKRDGRDVLTNKPPLQNIMAMFSLDVQKYLKEKYHLDNWTIVMGGDELETMVKKLHKLNIHTPKNPEDKIEKKKRIE